MGKRKQTTQQSNSFSYFTPPPTADVTALREMKVTADTSIPFNYAKQREEMQNSYRAPLGSYTSPAVQEALQRSAGRALAQDEAQAQMNSQAQADNINFGRQATIAGMTAPQFAQTGGTQTQTQSGGMGFLGQLLNTGIGAAGTAIA